MQYHIQFLGYIDEQRRPDGFPKVVIQELTIETFNESEVQKAIRDTAAAFIRDQVMIVPRYSDETLDMVSFDQRMIVPLNMITHIETRTLRLDTPIPAMGDEPGVYYLPDNTLGERKAHIQ